MDADSEIDAAVVRHANIAASDLGLTQLKNIAEPIRVYSLQVGETALGALAADRRDTAMSPSPVRLTIRP